MLVLSRQRDETIVIVVGDKEIEITVVDIRGDKTRLGITADRCFPVHRKEVWEAIKKENVENEKSLMGWVAYQNPESLKQAGLIE